MEVTRAILDTEPEEQALEVSNELESVKRA